MEKGGRTSGERSISRAYGCWVSAREGGRLGGRWGGGNMIGSRELALPRRPLLCPLPPTPSPISLSMRRLPSVGPSPPSSFPSTGRTVLNLWRLMRGELKLSMYSQASVVAHVLNRRHPAPSFSALTAWFVQGGAKGRAQVRPLSLPPPLPPPFLPPSLPPSLPSARPLSPCHSAPSLSGLSSST